MAKVVMKNENTKKYYASKFFPPITDDVWEAETFPTEKEAKETVRVMLSDDYQPAAFKPKTIELQEL